MEKITEKILNEFGEQDKNYVSETVGKYTVKSIKHLFSWNQEV